MDAVRRSFLLAAILTGSTRLLLTSRVLLPDAWPQGQPPPSSSEPEPFPTQEKPRALLKLNQKDIKRDVQRLVALAEELKKEVDKTDSAEVLSLPLVRKAEEIEKLARHIKTLARG